MKKLFSVISQFIGVFFLSLCINSLAVAHESVVVIPLSTCKSNPKLMPGIIPVGVTICGVIGTLKVPDLFVDQGNGTVIDSSPGLMWQQADDEKTYNWYQATGVVHATYNPGGVTDVCGEATTGGYTDWRLPTQDEMRVLIVCTNGNGPIVNFPSNPYACGDGNSSPYDNPTIDKLFSCKSYNYWSSSVYDENNAWNVNFTGGNADWHSRHHNFYVRCVR